MLRRIVFESTVRCRKRESTVLDLFYFPLFSIVHLLVKENRSLFVLSLRYLRTLIIAIDQSMTEQKIFGLFSANYSIRSRCLLASSALTIEIFPTIDYSLRGKGERRREARWRDRHGARQLVFYISSADLISVFWYTMDTAIGSRCSRVPDLAHPRQVWTNQNVFLFLTFRLVAPFGCLYPFFFFFYTTCSSPPRPPLVFPACFITVKHFFYLFNIFLTRFSTSFFVPLVIPFFKFFLALLFILFGQFINPLINLFFFIQFFIQFLFAYSLEFFSYLKNPRKNIFLHLYTISYIYS